MIAMSVCNKPLNLYIIPKGGVLSSEGFQQITPTKSNKKERKVSVLKMHFERETSFQNFFAKI